MPNPRTSPAGLIFVAFVTVAAVLSGCGKNAPKAPVTQAPAAAANAAVESASAVNAVAAAPAAVGKTTPDVPDDPKAPLPEPTYEAGLPPELRQALFRPFT